jgi:hypothetical protein
LRLQVSARLKESLDCFMGPAGGLSPRKFRRREQNGYMRLREANELVRTKPARHRQSTPVGVGRVASPLVQVVQASGRSLDTIWGKHGLHLVRSCATPTEPHVHVTLRAS